MYGYVSLDVVVFCASEVHQYLFHAEPTLGKEEESLLNATQLASDHENDLSLT